MRKLAMVGVALVAVVALAGCSDDSYDRDDAIDELTKDGAMTEEQAACVVDAMEEEFGIDKLNSDDEPTAEEQATLTAMYQECVVGDLSDLSIPDISIPDISIPEDLEDISIPEDLSDLSIPDISIPE
jgi:polyhydroxyalkanoate synthesis regulator phasin